MEVLRYNFDSLIVVNEPKLANGRLSMKSRMHGPRIGRSECIEYEHDIFAEKFSSRMSERIDQALQSIDNLQENMKLDEQTLWPQVVGN